MSGKLGAIEAQTRTAHQLEAVVTAMRGIAAARSRDAQARLPGIRASAATVGAAIGAVLPAGNDHASLEAVVPRSTAHNENAAQIAIVVCTEQGFVGSLNDQILERTIHYRTQHAAEVMMVGMRGAMIAQERGLPLAWSTAMVSHVDDVARLASQITDALYERLEAAAVTNVALIHASPGLATQIRIAEQRLLPFDFARFHITARHQPPVMNLPVERLLDGLVQAYIYVELCEAIMLSFAAENEARVQAMLSARANLKDRLEELTRDYQQVRQDEITSDIVELATGSMGRA